MPESPEVQALADELDERLRGHEITAVDVVEFRTVKTRTEPPSALVGERVEAVSRKGKLLDVSLTTAHLVISLGRHGWARYATDDQADASGEARPPALAILEFDDGTVVEFTDAGDWVSLGLWVVDDPIAVPAVAKLGPDPADPAFTRADFDAAVAGRRKQVKAVLQEQDSLAGIGNAYSDEILHTAKVSPVGHSAALDEAALEGLYASTVGVVTGAIDDRRGVPIDRLKAEKVAAMRVHGRAGEACPVCGDTVRDFTFASTTAQYCPTCQTEGETLPLRARE